PEDDDAHAAVVHLGAAEHVRVDARARPGVDAGVEVELRVLLDAAARPGAELVDEAPRVEYELLDRRRLEALAEELARPLDGPLEGLGRPVRRRQEREVDDGVDPRALEGLAHEELLLLARLVQDERPVAEAVAVVVAEVVGLLVRADGEDEVDVRLVAVELVRQRAPDRRVGAGDEHPEFLGGCFAHDDAPASARRDFLSSSPTSIMPWTRERIFSAMARTTSGSRAASFGYSRWM